MAAFSNPRRQPLFESGVLSSGYSLWSRMVSSLASMQTLLSLFPASESVPLSAATVFA